MIKIPVKYAGWFGMTILFAGLVFSCTEREESPEWVDNKDGIVFRTELREEIPTNGLITRLYVFKSAGNDSYRLCDSLPEIISGTTRLKMSLADLNKNDYRFLFVATPQAEPEMQVARMDGAPFAFGTEWVKVSVAALADNLSVDNYYGIKDLKGAEILQLEAIEGELTRLVGQMVFCFYKDAPEGVQNPDVASVLDRVSSIDIAYESMPRQITFDVDDLPVSMAGSEDVLNHTVNFSLNEDGQKVVLPQTGVPVEVADSIPKGAILKGACLFPCREKVKVSMTFHYYDTTPVCGHTESEHQHVAECYTPPDIVAQFTEECGNGRSDCVAGSLYNQ
ncbi:MAG: DUF5031 domain-containing protein [Bacteroides sp.]|nr:DUF5031 domain-containing protein [Bacteroides sp.]